MDENQKKQLEIIKSAIAKNAQALNELECAKKDLEQAVKTLVSGLDVYSVIRGHSEEMLAASALMGLLQQLEQVL